jgi:O-antigen ligase
LSWSMSHRVYDELSDEYISVIPFFIYPILIKKYLYADSILFFQPERYPIGIKAAVEVHLLEVFMVEHDLWRWIYPGSLGAPGDQYHLVLPLVKSAFRRGDRAVAAEEKDGVLPAANVIVEIKSLIPDLIWLYLLYAQGTGRRGKYEHTKEPGQDGSQFCHTIPENKDFLIFSLMHSINEQSKKIADLGIIALAFLIPSCLYSLDIAVLALIGVCRIIQGDLRQWKPYLKEPRVFFPVLFYLYIFIGFFFAHNRGEALSAWSEKLPFLLYPLIIGCQASLDKDLLRSAGRAFVLSLVICLSAAILYAIGDMLITHTYTVQLGEAIYKKWSWYGLTRIYDNWHPSYVSSYCSMAIAFLLSSPLPEKRLPRIYTLVSFVFLSICIFLLYSITGIIIYFVLLLFFGYKWLRRRRLSLSVNLAILLVLAGLLVAVLYTNPLAMEKLQKMREKGWNATDKQDERTVLTIRMAKWVTYLGIFKDHPLFGVTAGDIKDMRKKAYEAKGYTDLAQYNYNAHDQYIETLTDYGILGSILFLGMLWGALRGRNPLLFPFLLIVLIAFTTESALERQQGLHFFMFFYALLTLRVSGKSS